MGSQRGRKHGDIRSGPKRPSAAASPAGRPALRFLLLFVVYLVALGAVVSVLFYRFPQVFAVLIELTARLVAGAAGLLGNGVIQQADLVTYHDFSIRIVVECTGLVEMVIYCAAVLAFPTSLVRRLIGVVGGSLAIVVVNVLRMASLLFIGASSEYWFEIAHFYAYQISMLLLIVATWIAWFYFAVLGRPEKPRPVSA